MWTREAFARVARPAQKRVVKSWVGTLVTHAIAITKRLVIGNRNFEVASFSRRNRDTIAMSQSQKSHWAKKVAAIRNGITTL